MSSTKKLICILLTVVIIATLVFTAISVVSLATKFKIASFEDHISKVVSSSNNHTLYVSKTEGGDVNAPDKIEDGKEVFVTAIPNSGYVFLGWYNKNGNYISSDLTYSFTLEEDTYLLAKFVQIPEEITSTFEKNDILSLCPTDFSFDVKCLKDSPKTFLENNLIIYDIDYEGTPNQEASIAENAFTVTDNGGGMFRIKTVKPYHEGCTYVAAIRGGNDSNVTFNSTDATSLTFTTTKQETYIVEEKADIVYLSQLTDLYSTNVSTNGENESIDVKSSVASNIGEGTLICVYSGEIIDGKPVVDDDSIYGKCVAVTTKSGYSTIEYTTPSLGDIYSKFDVYTKQDVEFEDDWAVVCDTDDLKTLLLSQAQVQDVLSTLYFSTVRQFESSNYTLEAITQKTLNDQVDVSLKRVLKGKQAFFEIHLTLNLGIYAKQTYNRIANVVYDITFDKTLSISEIYNVQTKASPSTNELVDSIYVEAALSSTDKASLAINVEYNNNFCQEDLEISKEAILDSCLKYSSDSSSSTLKDAFKEAGYVVGEPIVVQLLKVPHNAGAATFTYDINFSFDYDLNGGLFYKDSSSSSTVAVGLTSLGDDVKSFVNTSKNASLNTSLVFFGDSSFVSAINAKISVKANGLAKYINMTFDLTDATTSEFAGFVSLEDGMYSGKVIITGDTTSKANYVIFRKQGSKTTSRENELVLTAGYESSYVGYTYKGRVQSKNYVLKVGKSGLDLRNYEDLKLKVIDGNGIKYSQSFSDDNLSLFSITLKEGKYASVSNGKVTISNDAPASFTDTLVIAPKNTNKWKPLTDNSVYVNLPTIEIKISYESDVPEQNDDTDIEAQFRTIYRNYSDGTANTLIPIFKSFASSMFDSSLKEESFFTYVLDEYVDQLFAEIKRCKSKADPDHSIENSFVKNEAQALVFTSDLVRKLQSDDIVEGDEQIIDALGYIENSGTLYTVITTLKENEHYSEVIDLISLNDVSRQQLKDIVEEYYTKSTNKEKASAIKTAMLDIIDSVK